MQTKAWAHEVRAFTRYKSVDGSTGVTALQAGIQFKNGLYTGGAFSAAGLPLTTDNITISGTAGNGYIQYAAQTVAPALALVNTFSDSGGHFAIGQSGSSGKTISFTNALMSADRSYAFQNKTGTLAMTDDNISEFTNDTGYVVGPVSAVSGRLPTFNGTTGKLIQDSGILASDVVIGPSSAVSGRIVSFNGVTGKLVQDSGINIAGTSGKTLTLNGGLTIGADASITGGGTLALAGFTFTVPATGTGVITTRLVSAGTGLSGGGDLSADRTISMPAVGTSGLKTFATGDSITTDAQGRVSAATTVTRTLTEGAGLAGNAYTLAADRTFAMGTPSTLSIASTNAVSGTTHSHVITSSSNPGAAASLLATDTSGFLTLVRLTATGYVFVNAATANLYLKDTSTGFQAATTQIITPQSGNTFRNTTYVSGLVGWNIPDTANVEFNNVDIRGALHAGIISYNQIQTTAGTFLITKSAAKLKSDVTIPASPTYGTTTVNIDVVDADGITHAASQLFATNDVLRLKDGLTGDTWLTVSSASDQTTFWRYVCKIQAGTNNVTYRAGLGVPDFGTSGYGYIMLTADQTNAPYLQMATHAGTFSSADSSGSLVVTPQLRLGNLNGSYGYASDIYGFSAGQYGAASKAWVTVDQTNGLRIGNNTTVLGQWDTSGNATFGQVASDKANLYWNNSNQRVEFRGSTAGTVVQSYINTDGSFVAGGGAVIIDSTGLRLSAGNTSAHSVNWGIGDIYSYTGGVINQTWVNTYMAGLGTNGASQTYIRAQNNLGYETDLIVTSVGSTGISDANKGYVNIYNSNSLLGVAIGSILAPTHLLDVYGTGWFQNALSLRDTSAAFDVSIVATSSTTLTATRQLTIDTVNAARTVKFTGNPTLADWFDQSVKTTATPQYARVGLGVAAGSADLITASGSQSTTQYIKITNTHSSGTGGFLVNNDSSGNAEFGVRGSARSTYGALTASDAYFYSSVGNLVLMQDVGGGLIKLAAGGNSAKVTISSTGVQFNAYGAGTLVTDASGNITASSDERLKTKIRKFRRGLDTIIKLEPIIYRWNKRSGLDRKNDYVSFGARHTKRHIPEAVGKGPNGFHTMSDRAILAAVVNAIKELEEIVCH